MARWPALFPGFWAGDRGGSKASAKCPVALTGQAKAVGPMSPVRAPQQATRSGTRGDVPSRRIGCCRLLFCTVEAGPQVSDRREQDQGGDDR